MVRVRRVRRSRPKHRSISYCRLYSRLHLQLISARWVEVSCTLRPDGVTIMQMVAPL